MSIISTAVDPTISLLHAQRRLAVIWVIMSLLGAAVVFYETTILERFGSPPEGYGPQLVRWFIAAVCSNVGLMLGVLATLELQPAARTAARRRLITTFFYKLTFGLSLVYLAVVVALPVIAGAKPSAKEAAQVLSTTETVMSAFQGFVAIVLGVFFVSSRDGAQ